MALFTRLFGSVKLTFTIAAMVVISIAVAIAAVLVTVSMTLTANTGNMVAAQLATSVRIAAAILEVNLPSSDVFWGEDGQIERIQARNMPKFRNHDLIDTVGRVTGETATLFAWEPETEDFLRKSTTILLETGERAIDTPLAKDDPAYPVVRAGGTYSGEANILGVDYYTTYQPILGVAGDVVGLLHVGIPRAKIDALATDSLNMLTIVGAAALLITGGLAVLISRAITRPIPRLSAAMQQIAAGKLDTAVPYTGFRNEIGAMARDVEVFRQNSARIVELGEEEVAASHQRRIERAEMMQALQRAFGEVVDAAAAGDFSRRVSAEFADHELNRLAEGVNALVETVDRIVSEAGYALSALANTDLTHRMSGDYDGALGQLRDDTNAVAERLTEIVAQLRSTSRSLKTATGEILSGANDLSERTTRQAATIEETSAAMVQLADTVLANAERAEDARVVAEEVTSTAEEGGAVMSQATEAMERIATSSSQISNIIGLIDDIAFQTNLLALNASVEAARAGEAGKGFAVVAVEVRRLAQSAAQASSEVKVLIEKSAAEVGKGSKLVADAAAKLGAMLNSARNSNTLMSGIAKESRAQAASIEEVNAAVRQLDEMTQHNAALVEEINAAIEQTEMQASEVDGIVAEFTLTDEGDPKPVRAAA
ncbi:MAG: methyl-accepting chemotaxis protein [Devosia sp.]|nr:methyl-accepting chemotaxis protein [Devosia sp.]